MDSATPELLPTLARIAETAEKIHQGPALFDPDVLEQELLDETNELEDALGRLMATGDVDTDETIRRS